MSSIDCIHTVSIGRQPQQSLGELLDRDCLFKIGLDLPRRSGTVFYDFKGPRSILSELVTSLLGNTAMEEEQIRLTQ